MTLVSVWQPSRDGTLTTGTGVSILHDFPPMGARAILLERSRGTPVCESAFTFQREAL